MKSRGQLWNMTQFYLLWLQECLVGLKRIGAGNQMSHLLHPKVKDLPYWGVAFVRTLATTRGLVHDILLDPVVLLMKEEPGKGEVLGEVDNLHPRCLFSVYLILQLWFNFVKSGCQLSFLLHCVNPFCRDQMMLMAISPIQLETRPVKFIDLVLPGIHIYYLLLTCHGFCSYIL